MTPAMDGLAAALVSAGLTVSRDAPFGELTTYGVGGRCAVMVEGTGSVQAEEAAAVIARFPGVPLYVLGNGSNTLVSDDGFDGLVVRVLPSRNPGDFAVTVIDSTVRADGWMPLPVLARRSVAAGACGLEWAVGVPGTVGGAVRMNAGGHGAEVKDSLLSAAVVSLQTGSRAEIPVAGLGLHFRGSALGDTHLVLSALFSVKEPGGHDCAGEVASIVSWRRANQPGGRNAGSVFVNPAPGDGSSGALIDAAGLRGFSCGGAAVSDKHANFILAAHGATAADVIAVMTAVQDGVENACGVTLRSEVRMVGFPAAIAGRFQAHDHAEGAVADAAAELRTGLGESA